MRIAIIGARGIPARWGGGFETVASELAPRLVARGNQGQECGPVYSWGTQA